MLLRLALLAQTVALFARHASAVILPVDTPKCLTFSPGASSFALLAGPVKVQILTSAEDWPGVHRVVGDLAADFERTTGTNLVVKNITTATAGRGPSAIIVGTLGKSALVDALVKAGKIDASDLSGKWESFVLKHIAAPLPGITGATGCCENICRLASLMPAGRCSGHRRVGQARDHLRRIHS